MESQIQEVKSLISQNRTSDAISILLELTQKNKGIHDSILMLSSKFTELTMQKIRGTISNDEAIRIQNQVNEKVLEALNIFDKHGNILPGVPSQRKNATTQLTKITISLAVVGLASFLIALISKQYRSYELKDFFEIVTYLLASLGFVAFVGMVLSLVISAWRGNQ